jgi:CHAD domain-containing protein
VSGQLQAVFLLGLKWQTAHHLILDLRSKAERGDRLAALAQQLAGLGDLHESATDAARAAAVASFWAPRSIMPISLKPSMNCEQALAAVTLECIEQIARNSAVLAEVDTAGLCQTATPEHVHQLRVGIRRLRSCWSLYKELTPLPPDAWREAVKDHFCALGTTRDDDVLRESLMPILNAAGQPPVEFARHNDSHSAMHLSRSVPFQSWLIEMLAWAVQGHPIQTPSALTDDPSARPTNLKLTLKKKLYKWHQRVLSDGLKFAALEIEAKHDLRKRAKRLRYGLQFSDSLLPAAKLKNYRKQLSSIQDILGEMNDLYVAREKFEGIREDQPPAWFAVGWIASRLEALGKEAKSAFDELKGADHFWD